MSFRFANRNQQLDFNIQIVDKHQNSVHVMRSGQHEAISD